MERFQDENKWLGHFANEIFVRCPKCECKSSIIRNKIMKLVLYSNTMLQSAIHLFRKYGFEEVELESGVYERANIKMEKHF